ncbi:MAG: hypothetical protein AB8B79_15680 [Granulosicoccus sp.]
MNKLLLSFLVLISIGCSSSETIVVDVPSLTEEELNEVFGTDAPDTNFDSDELPLDPFGSIDLPTGGFDSIQGRELVGDLTYNSFIERDGISIAITNFGFVDTREFSASFGDPRITVRLDNRGALSVDFVRCDVDALQDGIHVSDGWLSFSGLGVIDPGKSGIGKVRFFDDLVNGYNSFNELRFDCNWNADNGARLDLPNSTEQIEFLGYTISDNGYASVNLQRTNNSESSAEILYCTVEALLGSVILDVANVGFPPIDAGESFESSGMFLDFTNLQGFDDESFDFSLLYCSY